MQYIPAASSIFQSDQQYAFDITYYDTPFNVLHAGVASAGIPFDLREPSADGTFTLLSALKNETTPGNVPGIFTDAARSKSVVANGRVPTVLEYWAGGGLGKYGNSTNKRVALRYQCTLRSVTGRGWFDGTTNPVFTLAFAGNGYLRIQKVISGVYTDLFNGDITEAEYLQNGLSTTPTINDMDEGDRIDIYYVQDGHSWGGLVVKAVSGVVPTATLFTYEAGEDIAAKGGTFVRATTALQLDNMGIWRTVGVDSVRDGHYIGGKRYTLIEGTRTNTAQGSNLFADSTHWSDSAQFTITPRTSSIDGQVAYEHLWVSGANWRSQTRGTYVDGQIDSFYAILENVDATVSEIVFWDNTTAAAVCVARITWSTHLASLQSGTGQTGVVNLGGGRYMLWVTIIGVPSGTGGEGNGRRVAIYPSGATPVALSCIIHHAQLEEDRAYPTSPIITGAASGTRNGDELTFPFTFTPVTNPNITCYAKVARPVWADITGDLNDGVNINLRALQISLNSAHPSVNVSYGRLAREVQTAVRGAAGAVANATTSLPSGPEIEHIGQVRNMTTDPEAAVDTGTGLTAFTSTAAESFSAYGASTIGIGRASSTDGFFGGAIKSVKVAAGLLSFQTMREAEAGSTTAARYEMFRSAPVLGCGLMDDGTPPAAKAVTLVRDLNIDQAIGASSSASFTLPLINMLRQDDIGWEWLRSGANDPGVLRSHTGTGTTFDVKRQRLVQIRTGYKNELYTVFTGMVDDFELDADGQAQVKCLSFEQRIVDQFNKNYPDKISYMAASYLQRSGTTQPVYEIPAYDNWPLEYALRDLVVRAGIDESAVLQPLTVPSVSAAIPVVFGTETYKKFRARSVSGVVIRLERPVHYGNFGSAFNEAKPVDDEYIFKPENTKELWERCRSITDRYGYDLRFDHLGHLTLQPRNNPHYIEDLEGFALGMASINPSAYAGTYLEYVGPVAAASKTYFAARIDVGIPIGAGLGSWSYTVTRVSDSTVVANGTINPTATLDQYFYDYRLTLDGSNPTVATLFTGVYDEYRLTLQSSGGTAATVRRLDCVILYHTDPATPRYPASFSTLQNALAVNTNPMMDEMRNFVIIVGRRRALVTDSSKLETNPLNPESEFVVQSAVDVRSITDPTAKNYIGYPKESIIYDTGITDDDFATYLARTYIYRQRVPNPSAPIDHTMVPALQLRDPIYAVEEGFKSIDSSVVLFVTGIRHRITDKQASTTFQTSSYPEFPAYEPRADIDIDEHFSGNPVSNVAVSYTSLTGSAQVNLGPDEAAAVPGIAEVLGLPAQAGSPRTLPMPYDWPPIPGTVQIRATELPDGSAGTPISDGPFDVQTGEILGVFSLPRMQSITLVQVTEQVYKQVYNVTATSTGFHYEWSAARQELTVRRDYQPAPSNQFSIEITWTQAATGVTTEYVTNSPYHQYFTVDYTTAGAKLSLPWLEGDGTAAYKWGDDVSLFDVRYRPLGPDPYAGSSPFFDPYTSELGQLINVSYDALVSGLYRISIRNYEDNTVVAWLTEPTANPTDPESHWIFTEAGANKSFGWDGVDQIGTWNQRQSQEYARAAHGVFEQNQQPVLGAGFYVWNEERRSGALGPQAVIAADCDATTGKPLFGIGTYARWYVKFEAKNDLLEERSATGNPVRATDTRDPVLEADAFNPMLDEAEAGVIYTHLPEPTKIRLGISDWTGSAIFDDTNDATTGNGLNNSANWGTVDTDATFHNTKPVRVRFTIEPRRGVLWTGHDNDVSVRLTRHVHLRACINDQFIVYEGTNYPGTTFESRRVVNRRLVNDTHTITYTDSDYRKASAFKQTDGGAGVEWLFIPRYFKKNFRGVEEEPIQFGDYLQLEEVPLWDNTRRIGKPRSRFNIAFMNYLFYLSAYTQDRSGRFVWCVNKSFVDKAKIIKGTATTDWPDDQLRQHRRTVVTRQWTNEGTWVADEQARWGFASGSIGEALLRHKWADHDLSATTIAAVSWSALGLSLDEYSARTEPLESGFDTLTRQLGYAGGTKLDNWTWDGGTTASLWVPCVTRDFYPYRLLPPMVDIISTNNTAYELSDQSGYNSLTNTGNDAAAVGSEVWSSPVWAEDASDSKKQFHPGKRVIPDKAPTKNVEAQTMDYQRQDETVHYEDCRGIFSRNARPAEAPVKVVSVGPYYINQFRYEAIEVEEAHNNALYPLYRANIMRAFRYSFRDQYLWESGTLFPTTTSGKELLFMMNNEIARFGVTPQHGDVLHYDDGAWAGWKDDQPNSGEGDGTNYKLFSGPTTNVFQTKYMPLAVGPELTTTRAMYFHMVLVDERREFPTGR